MVAVGDTVHFSKGWGFFTDFLCDYIKDLLGADWGNSEIGKPFEERHPIMQWYDTYCHFQRQHTPQPDGSYTGLATGVVYCFIGLAYNLYLLNHNLDLQRRMIDRIKNAQQFQGAYYELLVANCLIRAGFDLELEDEADNETKHCEFSATSKQTGRKYWVEAKMRSVAGMLGKTAADGAAAGAKPTSRLSEHLRDALRKPAEDERLIFIDVNAPSQETDETPSWAAAAARQLDDREKNLEEGQRAYVFVTNMPFHRSLNDGARGHAVLVYGLGIPDFGKSGDFRLTEIWKQKQKHIDAHQILEMFKSYPKIPATFDGNLPLRHDERVEIGERYFFDSISERGAVGKVEEATVSETDKKMWLVVRTEEGRSYILNKDMSDEELAAYREHPDAYFGIVRKAPREIRGPYEFFEWLIDAWKDAPKARLLERCKDFQDGESLARMDQDDLLLELCERWAVSAFASQGTDKRSGEEAGR